LLIFSQQPLASLSGFSAATGTIFTHVVIKPNANNYHQAFTLTEDGNNYLLRLKKDVSFIHEAPLRQILNQFPANTNLVIDGSRASFIDRDIIEIINDFVKAGSDFNINVVLKGVEHRRSYE
jgi:MFS superfamily sulfate permease-like transporter